MARRSGIARMKVLVLTGPESSGKSWLAAELQQRFGGVLVDEYVRWFIEQNPRDTTLADIPDIARGQLAWEDEARAQQPSLLILDTHLLSNVLWSQTLFGDCPLDRASAIGPALRLALAAVAGTRRMDG